MTAPDSKRIGRVVSPAADPTSLAPSSDAAGLIKGSNIEDGDSRVGDDVSDFGRRAADRIFGIVDNDRATDREGGNRDDKGSIFKDDSDDGSGVKNDTLDFSNRAAGGSIAQEMATR